MQDHRAHRTSQVGQVEEVGRPCGRAKARTTVGRDLDSNLTPSGALERRLASISMHALGSGQWPAASARSKWAP